MATKVTKQKAIKPIIDHKKLKAAYCYVCKDFVKTQLVDVKVSTIELSPSDMIKNKKDVQNYELSESNHTVSKCTSCGNYDCTKNDLDFTKAVYNLVTNEVLKVLKRKKVI